MHAKMRSHLGKGAVTVLMAVAITAIAVIPATAGWPSPADRRHDRGMDQPMHPHAVLGIWRNPHMVQVLALKKDQVSQLRDADFAGREKQLKLKAQLDGLQLQMDKAVSADSIDEKAVLQLAGKIADIRGRLFVQHVESQLEAGKILSSDQLDKLKMMKEHHRREGPPKGKSPVSGGSSAHQGGAPPSSDGFNE